MTYSRADVLPSARSAGSHRRPAGTPGRISLAGLGVALSLGVAAWLGLGAERAPLSATQSNTATHAVPAALAAAARGPISAAVGAAEPAYRVAGAGDRRLAAANPSQHLHVRFSRSGVALSAKPSSPGVGLRLLAAGYGSALSHVDAIEPSAAANRVDYAHAGLDEWYVNGPLGVEQGFTVLRAPTAHRSTLLGLSLALSDGTRASIAKHGRAISLRGPGGQMLRYGALSATDASGHRLPSALALDRVGIALRVDTAGAHFPVTIDPLIAQEERPTPSDEGGEGRFGFSIALSADGTTALVGAPGDGGFAGAAWVFTRSGSTWTQQGPKLTAPAGEPDEAQCTSEASECGFGRSVALSADGDTALIGAPRANEAHGAAWVFTRSGSTWSQFGTGLTGSAEAKGNGSFGRSVALSADGSTALVGAPRERSLRGAAWTFARIGSGFVQQGAELDGEEELGGGYFGRGVALSADGDTALIGAPGDNGYAGAAWVFGRSGEGWAPQGGKLTGGAEESGEGRLGVSVALSADGDTALIGARSDAADAGAAWVFARAGATWAQQGPKLTALGELGEAQFGYSAALSADGDTALIGAPHDDSSLGAAWTFTRSGTSWTEEAEQLAGGEEPTNGAFGTGVALAADGATALVGAPRAERRAGGVWAFLGTLAPPPPPPPPAEEVIPPPAEGASPAAGTAGNAESPVSAVTGRSGVLASTTTVLPPPKLGLTGNVTRLSGIVRVKLPGSARFTLLETGEQIPFGSIVDARRGRVSVTTADGHGGLQTMVYYQGQFTLTQRRSGLVISALFGGNFSGCPTASERAHRARASATRAKKPVRKLWAEGHGSYSTKGNYATGAVLGTRWLTEDLCEGTLIRVLTDRVAVTNLVNGRRVTVSAGHSYFAKAPRTRRP